MTSPPPEATGAGRFADLGARLGSSAMLAGAAIVAAYLGGWWFAAFVVAIVAIIIWELSVMAEAESPRLLAAIAGASVIGLAALPAGWGLPLALLPTMAGVGRVGRVPLAHAIFTLLIVLAGYGLIDLRMHYAPHWILWLVFVVIATDVAGYFAGRLIGGPKFWPRVSPKKTWSGTVAGWGASGLVGAGAVWWGLAGAQIVAISVAVSMASQLGDIAESALKRRVGTKDSSRLLPGHGGFFDRFDGVLGAAVFLLLVEQIIDFPSAQG